MTRNDQFKLALHKEIADHLSVEPVFVVQSGLRNVDRFRKSSRGGAQLLIDEWQRLLSEFDLSGIRDVMTSDTEHGRDMRNSSVFAGIIAEDRRVEILQETAVAA